jgi:hypothetical protein
MYLEFMINKTSISGTRKIMQTKKGNRERFAYTDPLVKPLTRSLSGLRSPEFTLTFRKASPYINTSQYMKRHTALATARRHRFQ